MFNFFRSTPQQQFAKAEEKNDIQGAISLALKHEEITEQQLITMLHAALPSFPRGLNPERNALNILLSQACDIIANQLNAANLTKALTILERFHRKGADFRATYATSGIRYIYTELQSKMDQTQAPQKAFLKRYKEISEHHNHSAMRMIRTEHQAQSQSIIPPGYATPTRQVLGALTTNTPPSDPKSIASTVRSRR